MKQKFKSLITGTLTAVLVVALFSCKSPTSDKPEATNFVTYKANGATSGTVPIDETDYATGGSIIILDNTGKLDRSGYYFDGWNTMSDGTGTTYSPGQSIPVPDKAVTLFAIWKPFVPYTLSFDSNDAESGTAPATQTYAGGSSQSLPGNTGNLVKTGYGLVGWNTAKNGSGTFYATGAAFVMPEADTTLYAVWNTYFTYTLSGTNATITGFAAAWDGKTDIVIPSSIAGNTVVAIGERAFVSRSTLTSMVIPDTVTNIGSSAFHGCTQLTSVVLSKSISKITNTTFYSCVKLASIVIPDSVISIEQQAFGDCISLANITFGSGLTTLKNSAFYNIKASTIILPASLTTMDDYVFNTCEELISISIPASNAAFTTENGILYNKDKTILRKYPGKKSGAFAIANTVASIAAGACEMNTTWTSLNFPSSLKSIKYGAFYKCTGLTSLVIPGTLTEIAEYAFNTCSGLSSITINEGLLTIGTEAFATCRNLNSITLPASLTSLTGSAFREDTALTTITVAAANANFCSVDSVVFNKAKTVIVAYPANKTDASYAIPSTVQTIGESAFYESEFTSVTIPSSVTSIGYGAFSDSRLTSVTIPGTVTSIGNYAFSGCSGLTAITVQATTPPSSGYDVFQSSTCNISVPAASLAAYKAATNWSSYASRMVGY